MRLYAVLFFLVGCDPSATTGSADLSPGSPDLAAGGGDEQKASDRFDSIVNDAAALAAFLKAMPKGADLHNHLSGAVYAETYLGWGNSEGYCINTTTHAAVFSNQCSASTMPTPTMGAFYDEIVRAWSMKDFVAGAETGHDHFFATFGKFGAIAGSHRDDSIADVLVRAADENLLYVETMFNLGRNIGTLAADLFSGTVTAADLPGFYDMIVADPTFANELAADVAVVDQAAAGYKGVLGCAGANPPAACNVGVRFVAQVSRTGSNDQIFGQLVGAFEMAKMTKNIVGANLSSPEDDTTSLRNYDLHMAMLEFLYNKYTATQQSPLKVTLHAGEVTPTYLPAGFETHNTFHIRRAVEVAHAARIGHGLDILSETDSAALMADMKSRNVLVEICLSSNVQILEVSGANHPLASYLAAGVPVALATDDQGVSRSSLAGEYVRAATDQKLNYRQLKAISRNSLEHAFLPGASLWMAVGSAPVADCDGLADPPAAACQTFLDGSKRATLQFELERRFRSFESQQ
jgi:adenosine deaminase